MQDQIFSYNRRQENLTSRYPPLHADLAMACKNLSDVFEDIQSINKTSKNAQVDCVVYSLTEMQKPKKGTKRYFKGEVTDGTKRMKIVGFEENQQKSLAQDFTSSPIKISECEVQRSSYTRELEIKLNGKSTITKSPKKFDLSSLPPKQTEDSSTTVYTEISNVYKFSPNFDILNLKVKVLQINPPATVSSGKLKQDLVIADATGNIKFTLWENDVGKITELDTSYELLQMQVRIYNGTKYIQYPKQGGSLNEVDDIGKVAELTTDTLQQTSSNDIHDATVSGVCRLFKYNSCIKCKSKTEPTSPTFARCSNSSCKMLQKLDQVKETFSGILMVSSPNNQDRELHAFETQLRKIANIQDPDTMIEEEDLLDSPPFSCCTNGKAVITSVWRQVN